MANTWTTANQTYSNVNYSIAGATGSSGSILTTSGSNGTSWTSSTNLNTVMTIPHGSKTVILEDKATLEVKGTVKINGIDLEERLKTIERVLAIPERDATMEAKYPSLKKKFDEYINTLEKYKTWERIKGEE